MKQNITVDVLVATYNGEKYLKEQIDSIRNQTYQNIRILISDDGSQDDTVNILRQYEKEDDRIIVFTHDKNLGYIKNFEFLLMQVKSEYYALSDQDDYWLPEKIEKSVEKLEKENADLVYGDLEVVDKNLNILYPSMWKYLKIYKKVMYDDLRSQYLYNCATGCTILSKKKYINGMLPMPCKSEYMPHDYWITLYVSLHGKITHIDEKYIKYRQHGNNQIGTEKTSHKFRKFEQVRDLFLKVKLEHFKDYVDRPDVFNEELNQFNIKCLTYFEEIRDKKYFNFKYLGVFHRLYKYDTFIYYLAQFCIMNMPIIARGVFNVRYFILKLLGKR